MVGYWKKYEKFCGKARLDSVCWHFSLGLDERVVRAALAWKPNDECGISVYITGGISDSEAYELKVDENEVQIFSDGSAGAFYGLMSLKSMAVQGEMPCCKITDYPDMKYRGFYHDVTRGKIPTLDTLKQLVDMMAELKLNMLQLYVEHTFEFQEYEFCRDRLGYLTKEEMMELDQYCTEHFVEFVPSLATFGHLYHLLQDGPYQHLCELQNYEPSQHYCIERMKHHTINASSEESFELVKSLIDQYLPVFTSDKFNICGDETFDLGTGVNCGKDRGVLYYEFVSRIVDYLRSKGKRVMMWGDVILNHPDFISKFPKDVIFLPWYYRENPDVEMFEKFRKAQRKMISCPGTSSWSAFMGRPSVSDQNIAKMAAYAYQYGAEGLLNTNWGDFLNPCSLELAWYGLYSGAVISWNKDAVFDDAFRCEASYRLYGEECVVNRLAEIADMLDGRYWKDLVKYISGKENGHPITLEIRSEEEYQSHIDRCIAIRNEMATYHIKGIDVKEELISACEIQALMAKWTAAIHGMALDCSVEFDDWAKQYQTLWMKKNKKGELGEILRLCKSMEAIKA